MTPEQSEQLIQQVEAQTVILMRIYDTMFALLQQENSAMAEDLIKFHADGTILGPIPALNGTFVFNELNDGADISTGEE